MLQVIVNPAGAGGKTMKKWLEAEPLLKAASIDYDVSFSTLQHGIREITEELTSAGEPADLLVFGGDGTMNLVVNGIRDFAHTRIAFITCGSGNDLAKSLNMKYPLKQAVETLKEGKTKRELDVGRVTMHTAFDKDLVPADREITRLFNISCGIGFDAEICAFVQDSAMKKKLNKVNLGKLIYLYEALHVIFTTKQGKARVIFDDNEIREYNEMLFTAAMNEPYEGGGFRFGADAAADDGMLDFCTGDSLSRYDFFRIFPYAYSGSHVKFSGVHMRKAKKAEIFSEHPLWIHTDGEIEWMSDHVTMELIPEKLKMML
ncbi:MAG: hypothetical protein K6A40_13945 [Solobacterium sp.]|nr:hypothetical protein [Solobacterium sp.]